MVSAVEVLKVLHEIADRRNKLERHERTKFGNITKVTAVHTYWSQRFIDSSYHYWKVTDKAGHEVEEDEANRVLRAVFDYSGSTEKTAAYWLGSPSSSIILEINEGGADEPATEQPAKELLEQYAEALRDEKTAAVALTRREFALNTDLHIPYRWECTPGATGKDPNLLDVLHRSFCRNDPRERWLVAGDIGAGKSLLAFLLFERLSAVQDKGRAPIAVHIDLAGWPRNKAQLLDSLETAFDVYFRGLGKPARSEEWLRTLSAWIKNGKAILILDSLDELCEKLRPPECEDVLNSRIVSEAKLVTCRRRFLERQTSGTSLLRRKVVLLLDVEPDLQGWTSAYVKAFCEKKAMNHRAPSIVEAFRWNPELLHFASRPLSLNMLLDVLVAQPSLASAIRSLPTLLLEFVWNWLERESQRNCFDVGKAFELLTSIAWRMHEHGESAISTGDISLLGESMGVSETECDAVTYRAFLRPTGLSIEGRTFRFAHPQFRYFFAARATLRFLEQSVDNAAKALETFLPAEIVDEFVVPLLRERPPADRRDAVNALMAVWCSRMEGSMKNVMSREHASYLLGRLGTRDAVDFLISKVESEEDPWVYRGTVIGLAFAGRPEFLNRYVEKLTEEGERGEYSMRGVNIGYHLTYYGDQPSYDAGGHWRPDQDAGNAGCERTVAHIIRHLMSPDYLPIRRLDVATLLDLASQPRRSEGVRRVLRRETARADRILGALEDAGKDLPATETLTRYLHDLKDEA